MAEIFEVSQINEYLRQRFEADEFLGSLLIRGELSNYKIYPSGHHYFTLKDSQAPSAASCSRTRHAPAFPAGDGYESRTGRAHCRVRVTEPTSSTASLTPEGVGDLHVTFEQLKLKLQAEGLFARERKQALPRFPHRIAIITSSAGAALHDMLRILASATR